MKSDFDLPVLPSLLERQLSGFFPVPEDEISLIKKAMPAARFGEHCLANADNKCFRRDGEAFFSPFHSGQMAHILMFYDHYGLSDPIWICGSASTTADKASLSPTR